MGPATGGEHPGPKRLERTSSQRIQSLARQDPTKGTNNPATNTNKCWARYGHGQENRWCKAGSRKKTRSRAPRYRTGCTRHVSEASIFRRKRMVQKANNKPPDHTFYRREEQNQAMKTSRPEPSSRSPTTQSK